ncbi:MAG: SGNH/GDSL hydrolase family protein [Deltaproteobacteria bacterium]|nr:SGNH/GDSL hydrolase family protein [Deltaproteobacteria bacterium]
MRKDLSFQEIIPLDQSIAVINAGNWYTKNLEVSLSGENTEKQTKYYDKSGLCLFQGLSNKQEYEVTIKRTDIKGMLLYKKLRQTAAPIENGSEYIVLIGASVGKSWEFPELPKRKNIGDGIILGNRTIYEFDKSSAIDSLIGLPIPVSAVIIKECSAYFPRDTGLSLEQIKKWVSKLQTKNITPVLATVVTITKEHDQTHPGRYQSILEFNDMIRKHADQEGILVLDLEEAVRNGGNDRHLKPEYAQPDGNHLVKKAYDEALDPLMEELINKLAKSDG